MLVWKRKLNVALLILGSILTPPIFADDIHDKGKEPERGIVKPREKLVKELVEKVNPARADILKKIRLAKGDKPQLDVAKKELLTLFAIPDKDLKPQQEKIKSAIEKILTWDTKGEDSADDKKWDAAKAELFKVVVFEGDGKITEYIGGYHDSLKQAQKCQTKR